MNDSVIWTLTDEDAQAADEAQHQERMDALRLWAGRFGDVLNVIYTALRGKIPAQLADSVTLDYARLMLKGGREVYDDDCLDDGSDWTERDE